MALTRSYLKSMGLNDEQIGGIIEAHTETVDGLKNEVSRYKADAEKLPEVQRQLDEAKEAAKKSGDYAKLQQEFEDYKAEVANEKMMTAKKAALTAIAKDANLSDAGIAKVMKYSDFGKIELDEKGEIKDKKAVLDDLKTEWADYIQTSQSQGAKTPNPPSNSGGNAYEGMSLAEKMQRLNAHPEERQAILDSIK